MARKKKTEETTPKPDLADALFDDDGPIEDDEDDEAVDALARELREASDEDDEQDEIDAAVAAVPLPKSRLLKHTFSKDEIDRFRSQREEKDVAIEALTTELDELKERCSKLKKQIDVLQDEGMTLSRRVRTGHEMRSVSTEDRKELDARDDSETKGQLVMVTYRLDTNEAVAWRELTSLEKQGELFPAAPTPLKTEVREAAH